ncbi:MAG: peptidoglycan editing factor PgeF [Lachnospiraceae bacterium]|nr:peptidoglycan editing factor PgeF [Lachnospiraceae bacterium]
MSDQKNNFEKLKRKPGKTVLMQKRKGEVEYLSFPHLAETGLVDHLFTTRRGGVSQGIFASMNVSYTRGDDKAAVDENYRRIAEVFDEVPGSIVCSDQTHTTNIRLVTKEDRGKGVTRKKDYTDIDGLITNEPGVILATFYADCVPLFFVDMENKAIGLSHSGWKGTVHKMGEATLKAMKEAFGTRPEKVKAAIGPSICQDCYEVSSDVAEQFEKTFKNHVGEILKSGSAEGKYQLDLWKANEIILREAGILPENLEVTDVCTCCNKDYLFSHRGSQGKRGNLGAFMELRKS